MVERNINSLGGRRQVEPADLEPFFAAIGAKGVIADRDAIAPFLTDWRGIYRGEAIAMLAPASTADVATCVRLAGELGIALVPQGGNTSMVGGATPPVDGSALILSTRRMNAIRSIDPAARLAVAEAGVILSTLHDAALAKGVRFPLSLGAKGSATIGGLVSTNAGGTQVLRFGTMRALVAGIETVLPDGTVHNGLAPLKKDNRGYDLTQLMIGAEGTLGIVTAATLRLAPAIVDRAAAWVGLRSPQMALELLRFCEARSGAAIESFEIVPAPTLASVLRHIPGTRAPLSGDHAWNVLIELVETEAGRDATARLTELAEAAASAGLIEDAAIAANETQIAAFWRLRDSISEAERAEGPAMQHDISVPVDAMPAFMESAAVTIEAEFPGTTASAFGHLGDGNVHFHVKAPAGADATAWRSGEGKAASERVYDLVTAAGGSISAEHGIGQMKRDELLRLSDPSRIAALRAIKGALDPKGIMNPGKLVPPV